MRSAKSGKEILKIKVGKAKATLVFADEELKISLDTYTDFHLYVGKILSDEEMSHIKNREDIDKLLKSALASVTKGHPTKKALITKLEAKGASPAQITKIIDILTASGLIDDRQFMYDYLEFAKNRGYGQDRIIEGLYEKGVPQHLIKGLVFNYADEYKRASALLAGLEAKFIRYNYLQRKKRVYAALLRLGYPSGIAIKLLDKVKKGDEKNELVALQKDYALAKRKGIADNRHKTINYLLGKGYRYKDIMKIMTEEKNDEMD